MKSSHSCCRKVHKALLNSRRCYCTAESFTAQQKVLLRSRKHYCTAEGFAAQKNILLHSRRFHCTAESFTAQQKSQTCGRNQRKVHFVAEIEDKPTLQHLLLDFGLNVCAQIGSGRMVLWSPFSRVPSQLPSQKKPRLSVVQLHQDACLRYKKHKKNPRQYIYIYIYLCMNHKRNSLPVGQN